MAEPADDPVASPDAAAEDALDDALLALLAGSEATVADVFHERRTRLETGFTAARGGVRPRTGSRRGEEGVALRRIEGERVAFAHLSGAPGPDAARLATSLAGRRGREAPTHDARPQSAAPSRLAPQARRDSEALAALRDAVEDAARERIETDRDLLALDVVVTCERRAIHVASSEWGHAHDERAWLRVTVDAVTGGGGSVRRGVGLDRIPTDDEARAVAARLAVEAASAAAARENPVAPPTEPVDVLVAPGAGAVLVHEVVGHALEADEAERGASPLAGRLGERVASSAFTVIDDPGVRGLAGTHAVDDEGVAPRAVKLLDEGVVAGLVVDATSVGFDVERASGHGRRSSYREPPLPRLSNTRVEPGPDDPEALLASIQRGVFIERLGRAAADPLRGLVELRVVEGWLIEGGRRGAPLAGCVLVGLALDVLLSIDGVGTDFGWDDGCGLCGREGQWVPVAVGQPSLRLRAGALGVA